VNFLNVDIVLTEFTAKLYCIEQ